jgi:chromosome partitioning protein
MAKVLTLAARKGGSGKSTIAASIAAQAAQDGLGVALIDLDPQRSLAEWHERRELPGIAYRQDDADSLAERLRRIHAHEGTHLAVIDTAGDFTPAVTEALRFSDLTLVPVKPSILDVTAIQRTVDSLEIMGRAFAFVLSQAIPASTGRAEQAAMVLMERGRLAPVPITHRVDYLDAMTVGQGVTEYAPQSRAAGEVRELWTWVRAELGV